MTVRGGRGRVATAGLSALDRGAAGAARSRAPALQLAGSLFFTAFLFLWTFLHACVLVTAGVLMPFPRRFAVARAYARGVLRVLKWSCGLDYRVEGAPLPAGSHVALWKHSSSWETIAMMVLFPRQVWVLKRELLWVPVVGPAVKRLHAIAIDRTAGHPAGGPGTEEGQQGNNQGERVQVFLEGPPSEAAETRRPCGGGTLLAPLAVPRAPGGGP